MPKTPEDPRICDQCSLNSEIRTTVQKVCAEFGNSLTNTFASKQTLNVQLYNFKITSDMVRLI